MAELQDNLAIGTELVAVRVGEQRFAIDIMQVREIRGWTTSTPLPQAPSHVLGMINLRGVVLPVIDLGARLGRGPSVPAASSVVVVVQVAGQQAGLLVDEVCDIFDVKAGSVQDAPHVGQTGEGRFVRGVLTGDGVGDGIVSVLSVECLFDGTELAAA